MANAFLALGNRFREAGFLTASIQTVALFTPDVQDRKLSMGVGKLLTVSLFRFEALNIR
jgi:hypothetical protein